jgi:hypothetical protein
MQPQNIPPNKQPTKAPSTKPSITGGVFSFLALIAAAVAHFLSHADARTHTEVTTAVGKVDSGPVADIASKSIAAVLSLPFIVGGVTFGLIAIIFTLLRLRKVKTTGLVVSLLWILISVWAISIAFGALTVFKAHSAN